jgi:hypothetical protein
MPARACSCRDSLPRLFPRSGDAVILLWDADADAGTWPSPPPIPLPQVLSVLEMQVLMDERVLGSACVGVGLLALIGTDLVGVRWDSRCIKLCLITDGRPSRRL